MKTASQFFLIASIFLAIFGYWGLFTESGNNVFDEMDGYIPLFALMGAPFALVTWLILFLIIKFKK